MKLLIVILYSIKRLKLPNLIIKDLILFEKLDVLKIISKKGHYKDRIKIIDNINSLTLKSQYQLIKILIDDNVENISNLIIKKYEVKYLPKELKSLLNTKQKYWKQKSIEDNERQIVNSELYQGSKNYKRKFGKGESYQNVKKVLRKSMNTGKWF